MASEDVSKARREFFQHDPPTPGELESAIDAVEDALIDWRAQRVEAGTLVISDDTLRLLPGLLPDGTTTIEEVEARFQRLASASLGHPGAGNVSATAKTLGVSRGLIYRRLRLSAAETGTQEQMQPQGSLQSSRPRAA